MFPILVVLEAVDGFDDGGCKPRARIEPHDGIAEDLFPGFMLLIGSFLQVAVSLLELLHSLFGLFCGHDLGHDAHLW